MTGSVEQHEGGVLGLATGDALGTTLEFTSPGRFQPISDMVGGGPFGLRKGEWTDDTSMALCLAESLLERVGFDPSDQMERYLRWWRRGYWSSTGRCFDIGNTVSAALARYESEGTPYAGSTDPRSAGNGSLMRLAPVPLYFAGDPELAVRMSGESSRTTHGARAAIDACRYYAALIVGALQGASKEALLAPLFEPGGAEGLWSREPLVSEIAEVASGSFRRREPPEIAGTGYVVKSMEAALWAFHRSDSFEDGALLAVNLGNDADTTGAVYGQLAGAYYSVEAIPRRWLDTLAMESQIRAIAGRLHNSPPG